MKFTTQLPSEKPPQYSILTVAEKQQTKSIKTRTYLRTGPEAVNARRSAGSALWLPEGTKG